MKYIYILLCVIIMILLFACKTHHIADEQFFISKANSVILGSEEYFGRKYELWIPTENDIKDFESNNKLTVYFRAELRKIIMNLNSYRVQFVGIVFNDRRYIHCNFVHMNSSFKDWKEKLIIAVAGGFWYWYINYDAELKKVIQIYINGCT